MPLFSRNIVSNQVVKSKTDRLEKRTLSDVRKKIKNGELVDSNDLDLYLKTIDARYSHIIADINNATQVYNYAKVRSEKLAEARQLLDFFNQDYAELNRLSQIVNKKATEAGSPSDTPHESLSPIDLTKLKENFNALIKKEENNV
jgi:hypothetical protein